MITSSAIAIVGALIIYYVYRDMARLRDENTMLAKTNLRLEVELERRRQADKARNRAGGLACAAKRRAQRTAQTGVESATFAKLQGEIAA